MSEVTCAKWADETTLEGRIQKAIEPIISGGASADAIDAAVARILDIIDSEKRGVE